MRRITMRKWTGIAFLAVLLGFFVLAGSRPVSAATDNTGKCKVVFANSQGVVSNSTLRKWGRYVDKGSYTQLPAVNRTGYKCVWVTKNGSKELKYSGGRYVRITKNTKFCLYYYKLYTVKFYNANGKKEYTSLRITTTKGRVVETPYYPSVSGYKTYGWSKKAGGSAVKYEGEALTVTGNMRFYLVAKKVKTTNVQLCRANGSVWRTLNASSGNVTFPSVDLNSENYMCLGWSRTKGKTTDPDYKTGDKIPAKTGKYYMVVFSAKQEQTARAIEKATKYQKVYFVGDSRTVGLQYALKDKMPSNVDFVCKSGKGLVWFQQEGYKELVQKIKDEPLNSKKAVIINLGVNDMNNINEYTVYMKKVSENLQKKYNCKMFYLSVNPLNNAMLKNAGGTRTEAQVASFNRTIYQKLCSGSNPAFTYINTCSWLQKSGWISNRYNSGIHDGLHYSNETSVRIYTYCIRKLNA